MNVRYLSGLADGLRSSNISQFPVDMVALAERNDIDLDIRRFPPMLAEKFPSMAVERLTLIHSGLNGWQRRDSIAHEVGHIETGDSDERIADRFRDLLLMPAEIILRGIREGWTAEDFVLELGLQPAVIAGRYHAVLCEVRRVS